MKTLLTVIVMLSASGASAAEYCLVKSRKGEPINCFKTLGQCESKADRMNGWTCQKR